MRTNTTIELVKEVLEQHPATRSDDFKLINEMAIRFRLNLFTFDTALTMWRDKHFPTFEAITRARRKLQEQYPNLRGTTKAQQRRAESEERYREFFREN